MTFNGMPTILLNNGDTLLNSLDRAVRAVYVELDENNTIFENSPQGSKEPAQVQQNVLGVAFVEQDLASVHQISQSREHEEQQAESLHRSSFVVLNDLRNSCSKVQERR